MRRRPEVLWRGAPGYLVLARPDGTMITVTERGVDVWALLEDDVPGTTVVDVLATRYGVERATVEHDLAPLFVALVDGGYVTADG